MRSEESQSDTSNATPASKGELEKRIKDTPDLVRGIQPPQQPSFYQNAPLSNSLTNDANMKKRDAKE